MASVPTGTKLGKYEIMKPLASGGMAELLLARTAPTERPLVLKWIRPEQAIDGTFIETFVTEGRRAAQLHHPNIVEVHEVGREDGTHYLAMEYVHGDDLRKLLARLHERRAKLPVQHILAIATAVAQALQHAHEQTDADGNPVLHLGIKPGNVIVTADGAVKLADFGIGRAALTEGRTDLLASIVGYLSPEQCTGQPVDRRSDVFGLGILMYELSVGRRLFKGENELVTMATIVAGDIPLPTKHRGDLPKELEALIMKALARVPEDRFQSAQELHTALEKFATKAGVRGSLTTLAGYTKRLFGVRPEPWLVEEEPGEVPPSNDFDGSPRGLATPPVEATKGANLPELVVAGDDAPIMRVKKQVSRDMPTEQLNLASLRATVPDKSTPVKIPAGNGARTAPKPLPNRPTPVPVAAARTKPKTVQIPVANADRIVKDESAKVAPPRPDESTNIIVDVEEVTKETGPSVPLEAMTPTRPVDPNPKAPNPKPNAKNKKVPAVFTEDTVPAAPANGANGKPTLVALAGLAEADAQREAAKKAKKAAEDAARLPKPVVAGEIKPRNDATEKERTDTDVDELAIESTAVANPPPMPDVVVSTAVARDATEHVRPLPSPNDQTITRTDSVITSTGSKKWFVIGGLAIAAAAALVIAIGFTGDDGDDPQPSASVQPATEATAAADPKPDEPATKPDEPVREEGLRTSSAPRTPRNSHVTVDDPPEPTETPTDEAKPADPKPETTPGDRVAAVPPPAEVKPPPAEVKPPPAEVKPPPAEVKPPPIEAKPEGKREAKKPERADFPPPPKFEEPRDPSPPDEEVAKPAKPAKKPKPTPAAQKPKPKPTVAAKQKPTPTKPKPAATKPKGGNWDPNALFPK